MWVGTLSWIMGKCSGNDCLRMQLMLMMLLPNMLLMSLIWFRVLEVLWSLEVIKSMDTWKVKPWMGIVS